MRPNSLPQRPIRGRSSTLLDPEVFVRRANALACKLSPDPFGLLDEDYVRSHLRRPHGRCHASQAATHHQYVTLQFRHSNLPAADSRDAAMKPAWEDMQLPVWNPHFTNRVSRF